MRRADDRQHSSMLAEKHSGSQNLYEAKCSSPQLSWPTACRTPQTQAPFTVLFGVHARLDHLRAIGVRAFVHVKTHTTKLEDKAREGRLRGYSMNTKTYRIYNPEMRKVTESYKVVFIETPASTLIDPYTSNNNDVAADCQEGNPSTGNAADISATDHVEVSRIRRELTKLSELTTRTSHLSASTITRSANTWKHRHPINPATWRRRQHKVTRHKHDRIETYKSRIRRSYSHEYLCKNRTYTRFTRRTKRSTTPGTT